jgi:hypothetical protein
MRIKVDGKKENIDIGCGGCLVYALLWFWIPIIIIVLLIKFL